MSSFYPPLNVYSADPRTGAFPYELRRRPLVCPSRYPFVSASFFPSADAKAIPLLPDTKNTITLADEGNALFYFDGGMSSFEPEQQLDLAQLLARGDSTVDQDSPILDSEQVEREQGGSLAAMGHDRFSPSLDSPLPAPSEGAGGGDVEDAVVPPSVTSIDGTHPGPAADCWFSEEDWQNEPADLGSVTFPFTFTAPLMDRADRADPRMEVDAGPRTSEAGCEADESGSRSADRAPLVVSPALLGADGDCSAAGDHRADPVPSAPPVVVVTGVSICRVAGVSRAGKRRASTEDGEHSRDAGPRSSKKRKTCPSLLKTAAARLGIAQPRRQGYTSAPPAAGTPTVVRTEEHPADCVHRAWWDLQDAAMIIEPAAQFAETSPTAPEAESWVHRGWKTVQKRGAKIKTTLTNFVSKA